MKTITIDQKSLDAASAGQLDLEALTSGLQLPEPSSIAKSVLINEHGYILSHRFQPGDALLTISLGADGPLTRLSPAVREEALSRILRCTTALITDRSRRLPISWKPFHSKNRLSFQADRLLRSADGGRTDAGRVVLDISKAEGARVFAFLLDRAGVADLNAHRPDQQLLGQALAGVSAALSTRSAAADAQALEDAVALGDAHPRGSGGGYLLDDWYRVRLTAQQRRFVDFDLPGSIRLVGPAGTGKTIAMVVKCLRELKNARSGKGLDRVLFLTHASSSARTVEDLVLGMAPEDGLEWMASERPRLTVTTLYALANEHMRYNLDDLSPVSLDGYAGRALQASFLNDVIEEFKSQDWIAYRSACSRPFVSYLDSEPESFERRFFLWEVLNEFACVLDAEGVRSGTARRAQYLGDSRKVWMMHLDTIQEREVILALYDRFRSALRAAKAIGADQMVSDFLNHLDSFRWDATRDTDGFDAVFVDELHLFNRQERMCFPALLRARAATPTVLVAYDAKQSPRDSFLGMQSADAQRYDLWRDVKLGKTEKIELVDVFRYTPQIARALQCIDRAFPGQDLDDDWPAYKGFSTLQDGLMPIVCTLKSTAMTYGVVFKRAKEFQRRRARGERVAVLCVSDELFQKYLAYPDLRDAFHAITSRDEASAATTAVRKFIFSMPEFIAGLQYHTVLLIDANRDAVPEGPYAAAALRKFISQLYLGASRAEVRLEIFASQEHGGISPVLSNAVLEKAVRIVPAEELD